MTVRDLQPDLQIALDPVERPDQQGPFRHLRLCRMLGGTSTRSATAFSARRAGVAAFDSDASAMNHALGMSDGSPTGIPANFGVSLNG